MVVLYLLDIIKNITQLEVFGATSFIYLMMSLISYILFASYSDIYYDEKYSSKLSRNGANVMMNIIMKVWLVLTFIYIGYLVLLILSPSEEYYNLLMEKYQHELIKK